MFSGKFFRTSQHETCLPWCMRKTLTMVWCTCMWTSWSDDHNAHMLLAAAPCLWQMCLKMWFSWLFSYYLTKWWVLLWRYSNRINNMGTHSTVHRCYQGISSCIFCLTHHHLWSIVGIPCGTPVIAWGHSTNTGVHPGQIGPQTSVCTQDR